MPNLTISTMTPKAHRSQRDSTVNFGGVDRKVSEVVLTGTVIQGTHENEFMVTVAYEPEPGQPNPMFPDDGDGYPGLPLDPGSTYSVTFTENV